MVIINKSQFVSFPFKHYPPQDVLSLLFEDSAKNMGLWHCNGVPGTRTCGHYLWAQLDYGYDL